LALGFLVAPVKLGELLERTLPPMGYELVDCETSPGGRLVRVFIDKPGGVDVEDCASVSNHLTHLFAVEGVAYERLEVSSPGLDEPLKLLRQYRKNIGRQVELVLQDGTKKEGRLMEVSEDGIIVEETRGKNKKKEVINHTFLFDNIKTTKIQVVF